MDVDGWDVKGRWWRMRYPLALPGLLFFCQRQSGYYILKLKCGRAIQASLSRVFFFFLVQT